MNQNEVALYDPTLILHPLCKESTKCWRRNKNFEDFGLPILSEGLVYE